MKAGHLILGLAIGITINLFLLSKPSLVLIANDPWLTWSQGAALVGSIILVWTYVLSSRLAWLEDWFGAYDKLYRLHHTLGIMAFILIASHPISLAVRSLANVEAALKYLWPIHDLVWLVGWSGLMLMVALLFLTIVVKLPYQMWKLSHQLMGLVMVAAGLHVFFISSDVARYWPLRVWMLGWITVALSVFIYLKLIYPRWGPKFKYRVKSVKIERAVAELALEPMGKNIKYQGGQFVFMSTQDAEIGSEEHPYSIAGVEGDHIKLGIKMVGDYTKKLTKLRVGTEVTIRGPYGQLGNNFGFERGVVLVAGGIGITPMLGMLDCEAKNPKRRKIDLIYVVRNVSEAYGVSKLTKIRLDNFKFEVWESEKKGRIESKNIIEMVNNPIERHYIICGAPGMMYQLRDGLVEVGVKPTRISFEDFALK
ncbi:MAG: ferric reductase-like transmembrane domain-containing protein [Candidatus Shapirobacteria bacterium]